jgi:nucleoside-diphosphate-sugar epimerase
LDILGLFDVVETGIVPSNQTPLGALPGRFRRARVLIVGCGDVGMRAARLLPARVRVLALTSTPSRVAELRAAGIVPLLGNLDRPQSVARLAGMAARVIHLAPPAADGTSDTRTQALARALRLRAAPAVLVYGSTTGVYGDCGGEWVNEARAVAPATARAVRRVDAERRLRAFGRASGTRVSVLRIPGIYAPDRPGGTPRERLLRATPALAPEDDVYTNHIHADDLARAVLAALWRGKPQRVVHASDDTVLKMGEYFDFAADLYGLPRPPRVSWSQAQQRLPATLLGFMGESRRLENRRLKEELRVRLRHPTVASGLGPRGT